MEVSAPSNTTPTQLITPSFSDALRFWIKLGFISFGGPAGQIAVMHKELVEKKRWITESQFFHALNFCMILPGPEAQQLATYLGWKLHGTRGGILAGSWFVLPSAFLLFGLSWLFMLGEQWSWLQSIFFGLQAAVVALIADALLRMSRKTLSSPYLWLIAISSLLITTMGQVSFVVMIAGAALLGYLVSRRWPHQFPVKNSHASDHSEPVTSPIQQPWRRALRVFLTCSALWLLPLIGAIVLWGWQSTPAQQGIFFSKAAMVTFGGAYAVLPYVAQQAVEHHGWLTHGQMMSGLALAETTPGPLIMVLQFVGFVGGWQHPGELSSFAAATVCAFLTTWCTFVPCFLSIFLAAPYIDHFGRYTSLRAIMSSITAAIIGVMAHLCLTLAKHAWFSADAQASLQPNIAMILLSIAALLLLKFTRCGAVTVILLCGAVGWLIA